MKILILDNYDSFTYNIVQYVREITHIEPSVFRNDAISVAAVDEYDYIILSPGPGLPADAGIMPQLLQAYKQHKKILGICLGHQAIAEAYSGTLYNLSEVYHGVASTLQIIDNEGIFKNIPNEIAVGRYHSWAVNTHDLPDELRVTANTSDGSIMAIQHKVYPVYGLQFHPESVLTEHGHQMIANFLNC